MIMFKGNRAGVEQGFKPLPTPLTLYAEGSLLSMGLIYADIELINSDDLALLRRGYLTEDEVKRIKVKALVDSGAYMLAINENLKYQLNLSQLDEQIMAT